MMLPDRSGLDIIEEHEVGVRRCADSHGHRVPRHGETIRAMKLGAFDYIHKPFSDPAALDLVVPRALNVRQLCRRAATAEAEAVPAARLGDLLGQTPVMQQLVKEIGKVSAGPRATVLVTGESGTGKELVARAIHNYSRDEPSPSSASTARPSRRRCWRASSSGTRRAPSPARRSTKPGKFELAEGGTLFLDEIGDLRSSCRRSCSGCSRSGSSSGSAGPSAIRLDVRGSSPRPTATSRGGGRGPLPRGPLPPAQRGHRPRDAAAARAREDIPLLVKGLLERINGRVHKRVTRVPPEVMEAPGPAALAGERPRAGERPHPRRRALPGRGAPGARAFRATTRSRSRTRRVGSRRMPLPTLEEAERSYRARPRHHPGSQGKGPARCWASAGPRSNESSRNTGLHVPYKPPLKSLSAERNCQSIRRLAARLNVSFKSHSRTFKRFVHSRGPSRVDPLSA